MAPQYCTEHTRIELEEGKCIACGEVPYKTKEQELMSDKTRIKILVFIVGLMLTVYSGYRFFTS